MRKGLRFIGMMMIIMLMAMLTGSLISYAETTEVVVTIHGHSEVLEYDGAEHQVSGYDIEIGNPLYSAEYIKCKRNAEATGMNAGAYVMGLSSDDFENLNPAFDVTFIVTDGELQILPAEITVLITGYADIIDYDGEAHSVTGYDIYFGRDLYREEYIQFDGEDTVSGTSAGTYYMGLSEEDFSNTNENFAVTFNVRDGWLTIRKREAINLSISPETPVIGQEMTVSWDVECDEFAGIELSISLKSGYSWKSYYPSDVNHNAKSGSYTFIPTEGEEMTIWAYVYYGAELDGFSESLGPVALQGDWDPSEAVGVEITYDAASVRTGEPIIAHYQITGGSGNYSDISAQWVRKDGFGGSDWLHHRRLRASSGEMSITPTTAGEYGLIFNIQDENGWYFSQGPYELNSSVTVTGDTILNPLGIDFYNGLPSAVYARGWTEVAWDVTGGETGIYPKTLIHVETDNGVVLIEDTYWGLTNSLSFALTNYDNTADSHSVRFELTPTDDSTTGETVSFTLPVTQGEGGGTCGENLTWLLNDGTLTISGTGAMNHYDAGTAPWYEYRYQIETVVLENGVTAIGDGAFTGCIAIHSILIPDSVTMLGDAVFEGCDSLTAIYFAGSEAAWQAMTADTDNPKLDGMNVIFGDALPNTVTVWITGVQSYTEYNGEEQRIFGYNVETSNPFYTVNDIKYTGNAAAAGTDAGTYPMGLRSDDFENLNPAYDVTFEVTDGMLQINPAWITVLITGNEGIADYDGEAHEVTGYDIYFGRDLYREEYIRFTGNDTVSGTGAGTYYMGLSEENFSNTNENFNVTFQVTDGRLTIRKAVSINLSISPERPVIGQEMTISWDVVCEDFVGCGISVYLRSGQHSKSITLPGADYHEKHGSCTFTPTAGEHMTIYGNVYSGPGENGGYSERYIDQLGPFALQGEEDPSEMVRVDVTYDAGSVRTGETITANYRITGGSGDYDSITAYWYRIGNAGQSTILQIRDLQEASGELSIAAQAPGEYALVFYIRDEKGWDLYQEIQNLNHRVTVTGEPVTGLLGIDFYNGLPSGISLSGQTTIDWDITGGDGTDVRNMMFHAETDNGIRLMNNTIPGFSNSIIFSLQYYAGTEDSQSVTFTMTPMDSTTTGEPVTFTIPILKETEAELLLPASLERIEAEAFANVRNVGIYVPNTVTYIAEDAFDSSVTIFCEEGSYAESRCRELGLKVITVEWGNG